MTIFYIFPSQLFCAHLLLSVPRAGNRNENVSGVRVVERAFPQACVKDAFLCTAAAMRWLKR